jgi:hypothetical protein
MAFMCGLIVWLRIRIPNACYYCSHFLFGMLDEWRLCGEWASYARMLLFDEK